ncbi:MAG: NADP-dependent oxidoreductase, partial [Abditibacteriaceae bacterium]
MSTKNHQVLLESRPKGEPTAENFKNVESDVPEVGNGQMLLRTIYLSLDPYMRGRMNAGPSYATLAEVGKVFEGSGVAQVEESTLSHFQKGDVVLAPTGWQ